MARTQARFVCQECGAVHAKWVGRCESCGAWNSLVEEARQEAVPKGLGGKAPGGTKARPIDIVGLTGASAMPPRRTSGIAEFDGVCGGGLVAGSALLVGGDPGIGKSTLLLQVVAALATRSATAGETLGCLYISGEEAIDQVRMRAERLAVAGAPVELATATSIRDIAATLDREDRPQIVVIDSIQTMYLDTLDSAPGTVSQVRAAAQELIRLAKRRGFTVILVGHVTKEGVIAGPRVLEHMVDTVLYFENDAGSRYRIIRSVKNRFGAANELGVFAMTEAGLKEVKNPSAIFLSRHGEPVAGSAVTVIREGTRPMLIEVQALVDESPLNNPRRVAVGMDVNRLSMLLAVMHRHGGVALFGHDVFLNVVGGLRVNETAADLAVLLAALSSFRDKPLPSELILFGEVGLAGEIRPVYNGEERLREAAKHGFKRALVPRANRPQRPVDGLEVIAVARLDEALARVR